MQMLSRCSGGLSEVKSKGAPEELLESLSGSYRKWQIFICLVTFVAQLIDGMSLYSTFIVAPRNLNYTCKGENGSTCFYRNGTKCEEFIYSRPYGNLTTYIEKFNLTCDKGTHTIWINNCFEIGLAISYLLVGWTADRLGRKVAAMIFIPLQCLCGAFVVTGKSFVLLLLFSFFHGIFSAAINLLTTVIICDVTGNKWRTFALGFTTYPLPISFIVEFLVVPQIISSLDGLVALNAFLPLILLLPLLYFKNSPLYTFYTSDFVKGEEILRKIAHFNHIPLDPNIRVRPVEVLSGQPKKETFIDFWKFRKTAIAFLVLMSLHFLRGIILGILLMYIQKNLLDTISIISFGLSGLLGTIIAVALCHFLSHKIVIGVSAILKNYLIFGVLILSEPDFIENIIGIKSFVLLNLSMGAVYMYSAALYNVTPRMFPTGLRSQGVGVCLCLRHLGRVLLNVTLFASPDLQLNPIPIWITAILLIVICPAFESISSLYIWKVHNREVPDFIVDAVQFEKYYKPVRYVSISEEQPSLTELEITSVDLHHS